MCRWLAYTGAPVALDDLLFKPAHSLIDQSLHSDLSETTTNGDGFGVAWYDDQDVPALFRSIEPAWNNNNLRDLSRHIRSRLVFAHVRASTGSAVQQSNCHPFRYGPWLWMHNGLIRDFHLLKRDLAMAVEPSLYPEIRGSTDSELIFYLALTFGLHHDPLYGTERAVGFIEDTAKARGVEDPVEMTVATTDGERIWVFRYSSGGSQRSLYYSKNVKTLRKQFSDHPAFANLSEETRLIVSEPLGDLEGAWEEFPQSTCGVIQCGEDELRPFRPRSVD